MGKWHNRAVMHGPRPDMARRLVAVSGLRTAAVSLKSPVLNASNPGRGRDGAWAQIGIGRRLTSINGRMAK